jgi:hypothetical protein
MQVCLNDPTYKWKIHNGKIVIIFCRFALNQTSLLMTRNVYVKEWNDDLVIYTEISILTMTTDMFRLP